MRFQRLMNVGFHVARIAGKKKRVAPGELINCLIEELGGHIKDYKALDPLPDDPKPSMLEVVPDPDKKGFFNIVSEADPSHIFNDTPLRKGKAIEMMAQLQG